MDFVDETFCVIGSPCCENSLSQIFQYYNDVSKTCKFYKSAEVRGINLSRFIISFYLLLYECISTLSSCWSSLLIIRIESLTRWDANSIT